MADKQPPSKPMSMEQIFPKNYQLPTSTVNKPTISNQYVQQTSNINSYQQPIYQPQIYQQPIYQQQQQQQQPIYQQPIYQQQQQQQQQYIPNNAYYPQNGLKINGQPQSHNGLKLLKDKDAGKKVVAVIVTFCSGMSYDHLFTQVQQKSLEGTQVLVYACNSNYLPKLIQAFENNPQDDESKKLINYIKQVDHDCVVFNWQCSSGYSTNSFPESHQNIFKFLKVILNLGYMAMFSDFSLKALIATWPKDWELGPNPFKQISQISQQFEIRFKGEDLVNSPSAQLKVVGEMAEGGKCNVGALGGTIVYTVDKSKIQHQKYTLKVLTVVTTIKVKQENLICKIGDFTGAAGHILLTFPNGGHLLTSMGHWIELMKIDTSQQKLFEIAARQYGQTQAINMKNQYMNLAESQRTEWVSTKARAYVQQQAPCSNMSQKKKY